MIDVTDFGIMGHTGGNGPHGCSRSKVSVSPSQVSASSLRPSCCAQSSACSQLKVILDSASQGLSKSQSEVQVSMARECQHLQCPLPPHGAQRRSLHRPETSLHWNKPPSISYWRFKQRDVSHRTQNVLLPCQTARRAERQPEARPDHLPLSPERETTTVLVS